MHLLRLQRRSAVLKDMERNRMGKYEEDKVEQGMVVGEKREPHSIQVVQQEAVVHPSPSADPFVNLPPPLKRPIQKLFDLYICISQSSALSPESFLLHGMKILLHLWSVRLEQIPKGQEEHCSWKHTIEELSSSTLCQSWPVEPIQSLMQ